MMDSASLLSEELSKLWTGWEIRIMILLSLLLQIILIHFGSQRKYKKGFWMRVVVWSAYMAADSVATFALGNIAKINVASGCHSPKAIDILQMFWAPFLLLHLGGPDTITAYSLEDNELWKRHLLQLFFQVGVAAYAIVWNWSNSILKFLAVPIFFIGTFKFGERTYVLWSASTDRFKDVLLSANQFKGNVGKSTSENSTKTEQDEGGQITIEDSREKQLHDAYFLFERFRYLFAGLTLGVNERKDSYKVIHQKSAAEAFDLIAIELGFMYDVLYTKATIIYSRWGILLRIIVFGTSTSTLVIVLIFIGLYGFDDATDSFITFVLLAGAVVLEVYAFIALLSSDWAQLWFFQLKRRKPWMKRIYSFLKRIHSFLKRIHSYICGNDSWFTNNKRWSSRVAQFSLLSYCLDEVQGTWFGLHKMPYVKNWIKEYPYLTWIKVDADLQEAIFKKLQPKSEQNNEDHSVRSCKGLLARRGDEVLGKLKKPDQPDEFSWSTVDIEFDHSILVWHIATDICFFVDLDRSDDTEKYVRISKYLSNYMLYLLVLFSSMLPEGIGEIRFRDTCAQVKRFLEAEEKKDKKELCQRMFDKIKRRPLDQSVLSDGCKLARQLQSLESDYRMDSTEKWKTISQVWIEMLTYAANRCRWKEHAQQLWNGGELLTHVCLLMTNLGLSEHYTEGK